MRVSCPGPRRTGGVFRAPRSSGIRRFDAFACQGLPCSARGDQGPLPAGMASALLAVRQVGLLYGYHLRGMWRLRYEPDKIAGSSASGCGTKRWAIRRRAQVQMFWRRQGLAPSRQRCIVRTTQSTRVEMAFQSAEEEVFRTVPGIPFGRGASACASSPAAQYGA